MLRRNWLRLALPLTLLAALGLAWNWGLLPAPGPTGVYPRTLRTAHFLIRYTTVGPDRTTPFFAARVGREAEHAVTLFERQGFRDPLGSPPWEITLKDLGEDDLGTAEGWPDGPTRIVLNTNLADTPVADAGGLPATVAHEIFHGIQAAYIPDLDSLPDFLVEGTPDACTYAVTDDPAVRRALLVDTVAYYTEEGRLRSLARQEHAAAGYWTVLADRFGGPPFCRALLEAVAGTDPDTALQRVTGLPPQTLLQSVALRLYGEYVWRADELGKDSPDPPDPEYRFDLVSPGADLLRPLRAGQPLRLDRDSDGNPLRARQSAVSAILIDRSWHLSGRVELTVEADGPVVAYVLVGGDAAGRLADFQAAAVGSGAPVVLDGSAGRIMLLVLRQGSGRATDYRLRLRPTAAPLTPLQPLPALLQDLETPRP